MQQGVISGFLNQSIPSIPSRYIQPVLNIDENEVFGTDFGAPNQLNQSYGSYIYI